MLTRRSPGRVSRGQGAIPLPGLTTSHLLFFLDRLALRILASGVRNNNRARLLTTKTTHTSRCLKNEVAYKGPSKIVAFLSETKNCPGD